MADTDRLAELVRDYAKRALIAEGMDEGDAEEELVEIVDDALFVASTHKFAGLDAEAAFKRMRSWLDIRIDEALLEEDPYEF